MAKVYFHIDLNAFFANAEIIRDPSLKGKPLVISGSTRRSVVSTASYEARQYGIHSAMPLSEAEALCPQLVIVEHHFPLYVELSEQFIKIVSEYVDDLEQASIDECYVDVTNAITKYEKPLDLAWTIQKRIMNELHLPCSIGVAPNMFLAKMASEMKKPLGITVLRIRDVPSKMWPLPISSMYGIGSKTVPHLENIGINTIGDLANYTDIAKLTHVLGNNTNYHIRHANGYDDREIIHDWDAKSMGVSETFLEDITDYDEIRGMMRQLCRKLSKRLLENKKAGKLVSIRIKYYDFKNIDRSIRIDNSIWKSDDIFVNAINIFDENWSGDPIRLLGVSLSDFNEYNNIQLDLFDANKAIQEETDSVIEELNRMVGSKAFFRAKDIE